MNTATSYKPHQQSSRTQWLILAFLSLVMVVTRGGFLVSHVQDASWAVFFLAGFYLRSYIGLPAFIIAAVIIDFAAIAARDGQQNFYLTPSYLFIIPAYSCLWFAGRFFAKRYSENLKGLILFLATAIVGIIACNFLSSGGFYWSSTVAVELSFSEIISRTLEFLPLYLLSTLLYLGMAGIIHMGFRQASKFSAQQTRSP